MPVSFREGGEDIRRLRPAASGGDDYALASFERRQNLTIEPPALFRDAAENDPLQRFHAAFAPYEFFSAVVAHELRAGVRSPEERRRLDRQILAPFERRQRVVVPLRSRLDAGGGCPRRPREG